MLAVANAEIPSPFGTAIAVSVVYCFLTAESAVDADAAESQFRMLAMRAVCLTESSYTAPTELVHPFWEVTVDFLAASRVFGNPALSA